MGLTVGVLLTPTQVHSGFEGREAKSRIFVFGFEFEPTSIGATFLTSMIHHTQGEGLNDM